MYGTARLSKGPVSLLVGVMLLIAALVAFFPVQSAVAEQAADSAALTGASMRALDSAVTTQDVKNGWSQEGNSRYYFRDGKKVTGYNKIDGKYYYFRSNGKLRYGDFELNGVKYFTDDDAVVLGLQMYGKYYYDTMKPMTSADSYDFETFIWARDIVRSISSAGDSDSTKLRKAFDWVVSQSYAIHQDFNPREENWMATYARQHFSGSGGDCHADGAAFGYLAAAIGYDAYVCIDSWASGYAPSHCWTMIDGAVYDPLFYESKGTNYYGATGGTYEVNPTAEFKVPTYSSSHADPNAKIPDVMKWSSYSGLKEIDGNLYFFKNGKPLKNAWKTVSGSRYYFKKDGTAARAGSVKVKGTYYVFDDEGRLANSAKKGLRIVKAGGERYRVDENGRAVSGFSEDGWRYYFKDGRWLRGTVVEKGTFYAASKKGTYNGGMTIMLRKASKKGASAVELYNLLGAPESVAYSNNCEGKGYDGLWTYKNFIVTTIRPKGAKSIEKAAADAKAGKALPKKHEYICSVEAL